MKPFAVGVQVFDASHVRARCTICGWVGEPRVRTVDALDDARIHAVDVIEHERPAL